MTALDHALPPLLTKTQICEIGYQYDDAWGISFARAIESAVREPLLKAIAERDAEIERLRQRLISQAVPTFGGMLTIV
jgi:hypothetical protein